MSTVVSQLEVIVGGDTRDLENSMRRADDSVNNFSRNAASQIGRMASAASSALLGVGAAVIGTSANLAIEWESAWTNVEKTVSGSEAQLSELETALRNMATDDVLGSMENAHITLAAIAASAGALGVETSAIDEFTASVAALSIAADDVSAEEIATAAAQFATVTGMDIANEIDNWANAIAALGNAGSATEGQILAFSNRMSTLATFQFNEADILGYSAAMAGLGITAELGGTNFVRTVGEITSAVALGGPALQGFADAAGMTAEQFTQLHSSDPSAAFDAFIEGLSGMDASQQLQTLQNLNITGQEQQIVLMKLAAGYDSVETSLALANEEWINGTAALDEAARKADTTQGAIDRLKNVLNETGIEIGRNFTPGIETMAEGLTNLLQGNWVQGLNDLGAGARNLVESFARLVGIDWLGMLPDVLQALPNAFSIIFDNIQRSFERFFLDIQVGIVEWVAGFRQTILNATGGQIDIAPEMTVDLSNLSLRGSQMDIADSITAALQTQVSAGGIDLATLFFQDALGRTINLTDAMTNIQLSINPEEMMTQFAAGFGEQGRQTVAQAIEMALSQGDQGALEVLTPLANELEIDIAKIQADLQAAMAAQSFPVTVTADMTVLPGSMTLPNGMMGPVPPPSGGGAGGVPGATNGGNNIIVNSYGQNPWQMSNLIQQTTADSGVR